MRNPYANTFEDKILSATPVELTGMLYEGLVVSIEKARTYMRSGDVHGRVREVSRAQGIIAELAGSLRPEPDAAYAVRLASLYEYMYHLIHQGNMNQVEAPLAEASRLAATLREAWEGISARPGNAIPAYAVAGAEAPVLAGYVG